MGASQTFSDSDIPGSGFFSSPPTAVHLPVAAPNVAALLRLSEQLGSLRSPSLAALSDARINVRFSDDTLLVVPVHRCILAVRSPFFRAIFAPDKEAAPEVLELQELVPGFEVGFEALTAVLVYMYSGLAAELPPGFAECADEECGRHEACWPVVNFMLQVIYAASIFEIPELVSLFQRRLLDILQKVAFDDIIVILQVTHLCKEACVRWHVKFKHDTAAQPVDCMNPSCPFHLVLSSLHAKCIEMIATSDIDYMALKKLPADIIKRVYDIHSTLRPDEQSIIHPSKKVIDIYKALDSDDIQLVKMCLEEGHTTLDDADALHYAVAHCDSIVTKELLDLVELPSVDHRNYRGYTALHLAAMRKDPEILMSLLQKGAQPSALTVDGRKAIQISKRLTRYIDYNSSTDQGKASPKERLCIEILERAELQDSLTESVSFPLAMASNDMQKNLLYLESRVWLAEQLFPMEAKVAMKNACLNGTLKFKLNTSLDSLPGQKNSADATTKQPVDLKEEYLSRMNALEKTVELGKQYFPRCSNVINRLLGDDLSELTPVEHITSEDNRKRYNELLDEFMEAFHEDKKELDGSKFDSTSVTKSAKLRERDTVQGIHEFSCASHELAGKFFLEVNGVALSLYHLLLLL